MAQLDTYTFGKDPQIDGSTPILKNGKRTVCPKSQLMAYETQLGKIVMERLACNAQCPFFISAKQPQKEGEPLDGFVLHCVEKPIFIQVTKELISTLKISK